MAELKWFKKIIKLIIMNILNKKYIIYLKIIIKAFNSHLKKL